MRIARTADIEAAKLEITILELVSDIKRLKKKIKKLQERIDALESQPIASIDIPKKLTGLKKKEGEVV